MTDALVNVYTIKVNIMSKYGAQGAQINQIYLKFYAFRPRPFICRIGRPCKCIHAVECGEAHAP